MEEESRESKQDKKTQNPAVREITNNAVVAALYYVLTILAIFVPAISQFGPIQCRVAEMLVLLAFFRPKLTIGLTLGCFFANLTGFLAGQNPPIDMLFGTAATLVACLLEAYFSRFLFVAALWPVVINGVVVGLERYFLLDATLPWWACMGYVALGELIALALGYALFMVLIRRKSFVHVFQPTRHQDAKF